MFKRIDRSERLSKLIARISNLFAQQRGLPVVIGIGLVAFSFVIQLADVYSGSRLLELVGVITHNLGVLIALIGLLLVTPLGR